jgi:uncharacterized protein YcaQ
MFERVHLVQIDSVNVLVRSQELPVFARLGPHRRDLVPAMAADGELFEYWGHMASLLPVELQPLFRFKMAMARRGEGMWTGMTKLLNERPEYLAAVLDDVKARGPLRTVDLRDGTRRKRDPWWSWDDAKVALELLFSTGDVTARRLPNFEREYDLTERVLPASVLERPTPTEQESRRELLALSAQALGVGTVHDLCDYFRLNIPKSRPALAELVDAGQLVPVEVEGWSAPTYLWHEARVPRRIAARTLLSPFDSLVWDRDRTERVFTFHYRIEIYTPAPKRQYGYYVLPFLLGDELVARVDLKSDRKESALLVPAAWGEPGVAFDDEVADELHEELVELATWLGLERVVIGRRGDLADSLRRVSTGVGHGL